MAKREKMAINWKKLYGKHAASARQLWKCMQWDEKLYQKHKEAFEALAEYDRTGKMPKLSYKKRIDITIDAKLLRQLKEYCREHGFKISQLIERHMREELANVAV